VFSTAADSQTSVGVHVLQGEREMAKDNRTLGRFELVGIPPAPRGVPQIEVTFDIDANGIVNVSAKDMATGKEQAITITSSSGLSEDDVERMVKEADANRGEDQKRRQEVETRNQLDTAIFTTERTLNESRNELDSALAQELEGVLAEAKKTLESGDAEAMKAATERVSAASHKMAEALYAKSQATSQAQGEPQGDATSAPKSGEDEDVVDAEFTEVNK
jgi:molecular chaperone DnaK